MVAAVLLGGDRKHGLDCRDLCGGRSVRFRDSQRAILTVRNISLGIVVSMPPHVFDGDTLTASVDACITSVVTTADKPYLPSATRAYSLAGTDDSSARFTLQTTERCTKCAVLLAVFISSTDDNIVLT